MEVTTTLGSFELGARIGEGGMGVVYRGRHRKTGVPVAIKVIRRSADEHARRRFHREVQAHAGLLHPGVVYLFEYGAIDASTAKSSGGELREGNPFVAMELADCGAVRDAMPLGDWPSVRRILVQILDSLAYSHARGVIHRDLKPENFLIFGADDGTGDAERVKLADFGIAHALTRLEDSDTEWLASAAGTPQYMAPEQLRGAWRDSGPWTDLYAVGCIAWELVSGRPPFNGESLLSIAMQHESELRPPLEPRFPVPEELEAWVHRAMALDPRRRFRRAADALWRLPEVPTADAASHDDLSEVDASTAPTEEFAETAGYGLTPTLASGVDAGDEVHGVTSHSAALIPVGTPPPLSTNWRMAREDELPAPLVGTGLGLFGLREPPFVNRTDECDRIWAKLREVADHDAPRFVFAAGDAGTGKSRLAEWVAARAHEVGAMQILRAVHTPGGGAGEGLRGAFERTYRTLELDRAEVFERLCDTMAPFEDGEEWLERDARAMTEYLRPTDENAEHVDGPRYRFSSSGQKRALVIRMLRRLARERPVLLWLDDLQWAPEAVGVLEHLQTMTGDLPALLALGTVRADVEAENPRFRERLASLAESELALRLNLDPLSRHHQRELLERLLPLDDELGGRLAQRTEGHPLFAMQLLGHWIQGDAIAVGRDGFRVAEGRELELPEDIHALWMRRLERLIDDLHAAAAAAVQCVLERAAALGRDVARQEWDALCEAEDVGHSNAIADRLVERGLAERTERGWAFAHGMFVDSIERHARRNGRWREHHRRCAELLERLYPNRPRQTAARRAAHWEEATDWERAIDALWDEYLRVHEFEDGALERRVLERRARLLDEADAATDDPRRIENDIEMGWCELHSSGATDETLDTFETSRRSAEAVGDDELLAKVWRGLAAWQRYRGDLEAAFESGQKAVAAARRCGDETELVRALLSMGASDFWRGKLRSAETKLSEAHGIASGASLGYWARYVRQVLADVAKERGEYDRAREMYREILEQSRHAGNRNLEALCTNGLGEIARFRDDADRARNRYREFARLAREIHDPSGAAISMFNVGLVELMAGRFDVAAEVLDDAEHRLDELSRKDQWLHGLRTARLTLAAGTGNWQRFDDLLAHYDDGWPDEARLYKDHPWLLEMAGSYAERANQAERASAARRLARDLWNRLGDEQAADSVPV